MYLYAIVYLKVVDIHKYVHACTCTCPCTSVYFLGYEQTMSQNVSTESIALFPLEKGIEGERNLSLYTF